MKSKKGYENYTPVDLLSIEPISRRYYYVDKADLMQHLDYLQFMRGRVIKRLEQLDSFHFEGRVQTNEMKQLKAGKQVLEEDIDFLKELKQKRFDKKRGRKPSKRPAKRTDPRKDDDE